MAVKRKNVYAYTSSVGMLKSRTALLLSLKHTLYVAVHSHQIWPSGKAVLSHWNTHCMWGSTLIRSGLVVKQCAKSLMWWSTLIRSGLVVKQCVRYAANTWMWNELLFCCMLNVNGHLYSCVVVIWCLLTPFSLHTLNCMRFTSRCNA